MPDPKFKEQESAGGNRDRRDLILSVIIPCFNEEQTLPYSHKRLSESLGALSFRFIELIYVNDGSRDGTQKVLDELHARYRDVESGLTVTVLELSRNFGHSAAVLAGLERARGDLIAIIDADLQDPPELIPEMLNLTASGYDVVYGRRKVRQGESRFKKLTAWLFYRFINFLTAREIPRDTGDFRLLTRQVRDAVLDCREMEPFLRGIVSWVGFRQKAFEYERGPRQFGETKYPLKKMIGFASMAIVSFSSVPLRIGVYLGLAGLFISFCIFIWALLVWFLGKSIPGWTSLVAAFVSGQSFILILLGIIGIYLGRVFEEVKGRPRFILRQEKNNPMLVRSRDDRSRESGA